MFKHLVTTSALAAVFVAGALAYSQSAKADDLLVGVAGPMTGQYASFGEQLQRGATMAVKDINAKGGVLGKQLKLEIGDDACDPKQAVQVANDMVKKGIVFMAGHFCSGSSIPASAVYIDEGILQITPASTNPSFTEDPAAKGVKTIMRTCGRDDQQGVFAGTWLAKTYAGKNVAILDDKSTYGAGLAAETGDDAGDLRGQLFDLLGARILTREKNMLIKRHGCPFLCWRGSRRQALRTLRKGLDMLRRRKHGTTDRLALPHQHRPIG